jgi:ABC-2 type transport system permease protein
MKALFRIAWLNLLRDRVALALTFLLPIAFFTIFAMIFGGMGNAGPSESRPLDILAVDRDDSVVSRRLMAALDAQAGLRVAGELLDDQGQAVPLDRDSAARAVRGGRFHAALVIPPGFGAQFPAFGGDATPIELIYDPSNPVAEFAVGGMLQAAAFTAAPDILFERGIEALEDFGGGPLTPAQREAVDDLKALLAEGFPGAGDEAGDAGTSGEGSAAGNAAFSGLVTVDSVNVRSVGAPQDAPRRNSMIAYYAAGMGVMFLLFSMTGAAGSILEEEESGALERLLMSRTSLSTIIAAKWLFFAALGFAQVSVMFVYGNLVFGLPLWTANYLAGFVVVASVTALSASAFGLLLAALCRSRSQLGGLSTIIILIMSAVGGSMVPRFIMPDAMEMLGRFTFNGWAMDAFLGVFWRDDPDAGVLQSLAPVLAPVAVMLLMMAAFLVGARLAARRWETL